MDDPWPDLAGRGVYRWIHLDLTQAETADWVAKKLPEVAAGAMVQSETRPRFDLEDEGLLLNLRGVNMNAGAEPEDMVSLRMWVTPDAIVSGRLRKVFAADDLRQSFAAGVAPPTIAAFLVKLARGLTDRIEVVSLKLEEQTDDLEESETDAATVSPLRQSVIKLRRYIGPQHEALRDLVEVESQMMAPRDRSRMREIANRAARIVEELDATSARLAAIQDHADARTNARLTRNNYLLSVVAAVFLPLSVLTGLFGVNLGGMPGAETPFAFAALCVGLVAIGAGVALALKAKKWF